MSFNPDHKKQAQENIFYGKTSKANHSSLMFDNNTVDLTMTHNHLGMLVSELSFGKHFSTALSRISKTISLLQKFREILHRATLLPFINYLSNQYLSSYIIYNRAFS